MRAGSSEPSLLVNAMRTISHVLAYLQRSFSFKGYPKSLDEFTYKDLHINDIILSCAGNVSMKGIAGSIHFEQGADPVKNVRIQRIQGTLL